MIGNAVPVNLAHFLANTIRQQILRNEIQNQEETNTNDLVTV